MTKLTKTDYFWTPREKERKRENFNDPLVGILGGPCFSLDTHQSENKSNSNAMWPRVGVTGWLANGLLEALTSPPHPQTDNASHSTKTYSGDNIPHETPWRSFEIFVLFLLWTSVQALKMVSSTMQSTLRSVTRIEFHFTFAKYFTNHTILANFKNISAKIRECIDLTNEYSLLLFLMNLFTKLYLKQKTTNIKAISEDILE